MSTPKKYSCVSCARRKVKCNKLSPCSSCAKTQAPCIYQPPAPSQRHRNRAAAYGDLLSKVQELETLLHRNGIPFNPLNSSWVPSPWQEKLVNSPQVEVTLSSSIETAIVAGAHPAARHERLGQDLTLCEQHTVAQSWSELSDDLKNPSALILKQPDTDADEQPIDATDTIYTDSILIFPLVSTTRNQLELHPHPKHVLKLWRAFADNVNPLTKIIHAPTLQGKILETAWAAESAAKPLEAIMLAVYALAVASMKASDCIHMFGEGRQTLINRYRTGALRALSDTNLLLTRDLEVLQALSLVLMIDPRSSFSTTAVALALRIAHKMGLHRSGEGSCSTLFEEEIRVRLWWYIRGLNSRARRSLGLPATIDDLGDVRLPMNVNDVDLHPSMTNPPAVQNTVATEMVYCLMKYDLWNFVRKSSRFSKNPNPREKVSEFMASTSIESMDKKRKVLHEVDSMIQEKYVKHLDHSIPLHHLSAVHASINTHYHRFWMFHPRHQPEGGRSMSQIDQDAVFESSVRLLELNRDMRNTNFLTTLVDYVACRAHTDAVVYMVSDLRRRTRGSLVETAWTLLEQKYDEEILAQQGTHKFYTDLADLTLGAWEARWQTLEQGRKSVPRFIEILQATRGKEGSTNGNESVIVPGSLQTGLLDDVMHDEPLDWSYWNELFPL